MNRRVTRHYRRYRGLLGMCASVGWLVACRPSDVLVVDPPGGVLTGTPIGSLEGAEATFNGAKVRVFSAFGGNDPYVEYTGLLADEFTWSAFTTLAQLANIDARRTVGTGGFAEQGDRALSALLSARSTLLLSIIGLEKFEPTSEQRKIGEAFALVGYSELLLAEGYCAGVPLTEARVNGGVAYGNPLTTDSLLGVAEAHFDSALAHANGDANVAALASVGLGRARLDRGQFAAAAAAVPGVPTDFVYNAEFADPTQNVGSPFVLSVYGSALLEFNCGQFNVADQEGENGLNFVSARDPRLVLDSTLAQTCDGRIGGAAPGRWYYPTKFGNPSASVPMASGVEARLIEAEAALTDGQVGAWAADLDALRAAAPATYLHLGSGMAALTPDSTTGASHDMQVDVMFRERAFWLFGTGTRLGDLRRLGRQYGRDPETVFPTGPYPYGEDPRLPAPLPTYGADVSLTLPTGANGQTTNPNYRGCLQATSTP